MQLHRPQDDFACAPILIGCAALGAIQHVHAISPASICSRHHHHCLSCWHAGRQFEHHLLHSIVLRRYVYTAIDEATRFKRAASRATRRAGAKGRGTVFLRSRRPAVTSTGISLILKAKGPPNGRSNPSTPAGGCSEEVLVGRAARSSAA